MNGTTVLESVARKYGRYTYYIKSVQLLQLTSILLIVARQSYSLASHTLHAGPFLTVTVAAL